ncbi:aggregation factor core [Ruegeria sp. R13_0]|uniref:aggregation factor core n=1 Tax=Ruegeria sp. R13_0 TaxID=2821099 RepID=UPI001ADAA4DE|nr:aggregation factor core [Ruegeria sp. R13_0]MBO9433176.1 aggregation factor core [Ruegeria sp. R13_0]
MLRLYVLAIAIGLWSTRALHAGLEVRFLEGAPKDQFTVINVGHCDLESSTLRVDLSPSSGRLIFDVSEAGAGVEVFQPLEFTEGADALLDVPLVVDGQDFIELQIASFKVGSNIAFTIDVDDTIGQREITVSGSEIAGATVSYAKEGETSTAVFSADAQTLLKIPDC